MHGCTLFKSIGNCIPSRHLWHSFHQTMIWDTLILISHIFRMNNMQIGMLPRLEALHTDKLSITQLFSASPITACVYLIGRHWRMKRHFWWWTRHSVSQRHASCNMTLKVNQCWINFLWADVRLYKAVNSIILNITEQCWLMLKE